MTLETHVVRSHLWQASGAWHQTITAWVWCPGSISEPILGSQPSLPTVCLAGLENPETGISNVGGWKRSPLNFQKLTAINIIRRHASLITLGSGLGGTKQVNSWMN